MRSFAAVTSSVAANAKLAERSVVGLAGSVPLSCVFGASVSGATKFSTAGVESTLPWSSTARTSKTCSPAARPVYVFGLTQFANALSSVLSRRHWKLSCVSMLSVPPKVNVVGPSAIGAIVVSGSTVSSPIVHVKVAGVESSFPARSIAYTSNLCGPTERPVYSTWSRPASGQYAYAPSSSEQRKSAPVGSVEVNVNVADVAVVEASGCDTIVVFGASWSGSRTSHVQVAASASTFPARSVATTEKVCVPTPTPSIRYGAGSVGSAGLQSGSSAPSSLHVNVAASFAWNVNSANVSSVSAGGPASMIVCGATPSSVTVHVQVAGVRSMLPMRSSACTSKVCVPGVISGKPISTSGKTAGERHSPSSTPSSQQMKVEPCSVEVNEKAAVLLDVVSCGPYRIDVSGAFATSKLYSAGISPATPYSLTTRTSKMYSPSLRSV